MLGIATRISGLLALRNRLVASSAARLLWAAPPSASFLVGYYGSAWLTTSVPRRDPATGLDLLMPCVPAFVWVYLAGLFLPFAPLLLLPQRQLPRMALAYSALIGAAAISFLALPTDGAALRASCADPGWALLAVYRFDPPTNLFPSLHVGLPTLACLCLKQATRAGPRWSPPSRRHRRSRFASSSNTCWPTSWPAPFSPGSPTGSRWPVRARWQASPEHQGTGPAARRSRRAPDRLHHPHHPAPSDSRYCRSA